METYRTVIKVGRGRVRLLEAWRGGVWFCPVGTGMVGSGAAWRGRAWSGGAWIGKVRQGKRIY